MVSGHLAMPYLETHFIEHTNIQLWQVSHRGCERHFRIHTYTIYTYICRIRFPYHPRKTNTKCACVNGVPIKECPSSYLPTILCNVKMALILNYDFILCLFLLLLQLLININQCLGSGRIRIILPDPDPGSEKIRDQLA